MAINHEVNLIIEIIHFKILYVSQILLTEVAIASVASRHRGGYFASTSQQIANVNYILYILAIHE